MARPSTTASTTEPRKCPFCGRELRPLTANLFGRTVTFGYEDCDCEQAVALRDEEQRRKDAEEREEAARRQERMFEDQCSRVGIPRRYRGSQSPFSEGCADALLSGRNVILWGPVGTGKTTALCATATRLLGAGGVSPDDVELTSVGEILSEVQLGFKSGTDPIGRHASKRFLLLDDLGKEQPTGFVLSRLFSLVNRRYNEMLPTAVTTQYRPSALIARLSERGDSDTAQAIVSRLTQDAVSIEIGGRDRRVTHKASPQSSLPKTGN